jgi:hypothetical protein
MESVFSSEKFENFSQTTQKTVMSTVTAVTIFNINVSLDKA